MKNPDLEREGLPSASTWRRHELCHGSWQLEAEAHRLGQAVHQYSADAQAGERIHAWLAGEPAELTESELLSASFLKERADEQRNRIFGDAQTRVELEQRYWLELDGRKALSGRADRVVSENGMALIQDFKTGFREPEVA